MLDLDHFKQINDNYGHQAGDDVLRQVAGVIRATLRDVDIAGRYGGEEFMIILMHTAPEQARIAAERLRSGVEGLPSRCSSRPVTISGGLCSYAGQDPIEMVRAADEFLYRAKANGRNRIEW
jgi:diguanylate cyclase (GGDEF)-like protein